MTNKNFINKYDLLNQFDVLKNSYEQIDYAAQNNYEIKNINTKIISNIVISGLGGSAIAGEFLQNFLRDDLKINLIVNRNYNLPKFIDKNSLVIISSYSGNTEETISVFKEAIEKKCQVIVLSTGGVVKEIAEKNQLDFILLKSGYQPRYAFFVSFFSLLKIFQTLELIDNHDQLIKWASEFIKQKGDEYSSEENIATINAKELIGFLPIIYSVADVTNSVGNRYKCQLNENAKVHAFCNLFPELNHNEIIGWETVTENNFKSKVVNIIDDSYNAQIKKRFAITTELISQSGIQVLELKSKLGNFKERLIDLIYLCDWISFYLAIYRSKDPSEIDFIHLLKNRLSQ